MVVCHLSDLSKCSVRYVLCWGCFTLLESMYMNYNIYIVTNTHTRYPHPSQIVYPVPTINELPTDDPRLQGTGKYEPLVHMNSIMSDEVRRVMTSLASSPSEWVSTSTLLSGALSKSLCCILTVF